MPEISNFYGISILMYYKDHNPPHFHAEYGDCGALIDIQAVEPIEGALPRREMKRVLEWTEKHQSELLENWERCQAHQKPKRIAPAA
jgi:hypothetical protein